MGLFTSTPAPPTATTREARQACWTSRDAYFGCLDAKNVNVPGMEAKGECNGEKKEFERECAASWVDYFNKRRVIQLRQDMLEKQAEETRRNPITSSTTSTGR